MSFYHSDAVASGMRVAQISFFSDPAQRRPRELLGAWTTLTDVAESAARAGARVSVIQASAHCESFERNGVAYHFLPLRSTLPALLRDIAPQVLHVHGLGFPREVLTLAALAPAVPIVLQDHANRLPRLWRRSQWRRCARAISGIAFCSSEQAREFATAGLLAAGTMIHEIPEGTSRFAPGDREEARRAIGAAGDPLVLWVGHLNSNKDPLTVLEGVSRAVHRLPHLNLLCCFGSAPLLPAVENRIANDPLLASRVRLLGTVPHERIEHLMRAADIFVLGSRREGSGYALIEALACGLPPVVTNIPSFRALTGNGTVGGLWPSGDPGALCDALVATAVVCGPAMRAAVRAHFDRELSPGALGCKLVGMYGGMVRRAGDAA